MQVDLSSNFFNLFGLPVSFSIDDRTLVSRFRELQKQLHPDKYASASDAERRWSMQAASFVNEAYQTLGNDLRRANYLLELNGISTDEETDTQMELGFLMEQMEYREALESAPGTSDPFAALDTIRKQLSASVNARLAAFAAAATEQNWTQARSIVRQWQFLSKLARELKSMEERLDA